MPDKTLITVETLVDAPADKVWTLWTEPKHIMQWNCASPDWHTPRAMSDLREGGTFTSRMEAKDGSMGFDFAGTFTKVIPAKKLEYAMSDGRTVSISFDAQGKKTKVTEVFVAESENPVDMQRAGWQSILDNFKKYAEAR